MSWTVDDYRSILGVLTGRGTTFAAFEDPPEGAAPRVYLRHDVDLSLGAAVEFADLNAAAGARATFFLLLRSPVYNLLSEPVLGMARRLLAAGQAIGLHVAVPTTVAGSAAALTELVLADFAIVRRHLPELAPVFAWHNTTPDLIERGLDLKVPGLVNAYSAELFRDIAYLSDTGMRYTVEQWLRLAGDEAAPAMQLLFHPELWVGGAETPAEALARSWPRVIREREVEFRLNRHYGACFPEGMPESLMTTLVDGLVSAVAARSREPQ